MPSLLSNSNIFHLASNYTSALNTASQTTFADSSPYPLSAPIPIFMPHSMINESGKNPITLNPSSKYSPYNTNPANKLDTISSLLNQTKNSSESYHDSNDSGASYQDYNIYSSLSPVSSISSISSLSDSPTKENQLDTEKPALSQINSPVINIQNLNSCNLGRDNSISYNTNMTNGSASGTTNYNVLNENYENRRFDVIGANSIDLVKHTQRMTVSSCLSNCDTNEFPVSRIYLMYNDQSW